jgi:hypothetical protein
MYFAALPNRNSSLSDISADVSATVTSRGEHCHRGAIGRSRIIYSVLEGPSYPHTCSTTLQSAKSTSFLKFALVGL